MATPTRDTVPAGIFKGQAFYVLGDDAGFSETYWTEATDYTVALTQVQSIVQARLGLSNSDLICRYIRVSQDTIKGDVLSVDNGVDGSIGGFGGVLSAPPTTTVHYQLFLTGAGKVVRHLHGVPASLLDATDCRSWTADMTWTSAFDTFKASLVSQKMRIPRYTFNKATNNYDYLGVKSVSSADFDDSNVWEHKVGRPFGLPRGRR